MSNFKQKLLIYLTSLSISSLLISNLVAVKLWDFFGIAVDGGILVFPFMYITSDLIVEFFGKKTAKDIIFAGFFVNIMAIIVFTIAVYLPAFHGWNQQEAFASILGFTPRIVVASLIAYVSSTLFNNYLFTKLKNKKGIFADRFIARALGSSAVAHFIDSGIFETVAFFGVLPFSDFLKQALFAYLIGFAFELILSPLEAVIAKKVGGKINDSI